MTNRNDNGAVAAIAAVAALAAASFIKKRGQKNEISQPESLSVQARGPERALSDARDKSMPAAWWRDYMASKGVTAQQMKIRNFDEFEQNAKGSVTKAEILSWFEKNPVNIKEVWRGLPPDDALGEQEKNDEARRKALQRKIKTALSKMGIADNTYVDTAIGGGFIETPAGIMFNAGPVKTSEIIAQRGGHTLSYAYEDVNGRWPVQFDNQEYLVKNPTRLGDIKVPVKGKPVWAACSWRTLIVNGEEFTIEGQIEPIEIPDSGGRTADQFYSASIAVSPDGKLVAIGTNLYTIILWDVAKKKILKVHKCKSPIGFVVCGLAWTAQGLFYSDQAGRLELLRVSPKGDMKEISVLNEGLLPFINPKASGDRPAGSVYADKTEEAFNASTAGIESLHVSPNDRYLASLSSADGIAIYDLENIEKEPMRGGRALDLAGGSWLNQNDYFMAMGNKEIAYLGVNGGNFNRPVESLEGGRGFALDKSGIIARIADSSVRIAMIPNGSEIEQMIREYVRIPVSESSTSFSTYIHGEPEAYREMLLIYKPDQLIQPAVRHWVEHNPFGWARMTWRPGKSGRVLFVDEVQSDWAQQARQHPKDYAKHPMPGSWWAAILKYAMVEAIRTNAKAFALSDAETIGKVVGNSTWKKQLAPFYDVQMANWMKKFGESFGIEIQQIPVNGMPKSSYLGFMLNPENVEKIRRSGLSLFGSDRPAETKKQKVKKQKQTSEAEIVGYKWSTTKQDFLNAYKARDVDSGIEFIMSLRPDKDQSHRTNPLPIGSTVTYAHEGEAASGAPKGATLAD
jgi:hypothetical protein